MEAKNTQTLDIISIPGHLCICFCLGGGPGSCFNRMAPATIHKGGDMEPQLLGLEVVPHHLLPGAEICTLEDWDGGVESGA